jgi:hypothetical protein
MVKANLLNMEEVSVKVILDNHDGSSVECTEKGIKLNESHILSVFSEGISVNEYHYDEIGNIVLGDEVFSLQGELNEEQIDLSKISSMTAVEFVMYLASVSSTKKGGVLS